MGMGFDGMSVVSVGDIKPAMNLTWSRMSMMENLSPAGMLQHVTPDEVYEQALVH